MGRVVEFVMVVKMTGWLKKTEGGEGGPSGSAGCAGRAQRRRS